MTATTPSSATAQTRHHRPRRTIPGVLAAAAILAAPLAMSVLPADAAHADATCSTQITNRVNGLAFPYYYPATLVIQRDDNRWTSYSTGRLFHGSNGHLTGNYFGQAFSDRTYSRNNFVVQNFDATVMDSHTIDVSPTGVLSIHSNTWNNNSSNDLSCVGGLLTGYDAVNRQLLTLTIGDRESLPQ